MTPTRNREGSFRDKAALDNLQARVGHFFKDVSLLRQALTHPSAAIEDGLPRIMSYERLEFLGDSLVNLFLAEALFDRFPHQDEGVLTRLRAYWASQPSLAQSAREMKLGELVRLGAGETRDRGDQKERILASVLESLFAALYLDAGLKASRKLASTLWSDPIRRRGLTVLQEDAKTNLQERRQAQGLPLPRYQTEALEGTFRSRVYLDDTLAGQGTGTSRKASEQAAARDALAGSSVNEPPTGT